VQQNVAFKYFWNTTSNQTNNLHATNKHSRDVLNIISKASFFG